MTIDRYILRDILHAYIMSFQYLVHLVYRDSYIIVTESIWLKFILLATAASIVLSDKNKKDLFGFAISPRSIQTIVYWSIGIYMITNISHLTREVINMIYESYI